MIGRVINGAGRLSRAPGAVVAFVLMAAIVPVVRPLCAQGPDSTWQQHTVALEAARARGAWDDVQHHVERLEAITGPNPAYTLNRARVAVHRGDTAAAYTALRTFAATGLVRDLATDAALGPLRGTAAWAAIADRMRENAAPRGVPVTVFTLPDTECIAEDLAWDAPRRRWLVSSVRRGAVFAVSPAGAVTTLARVGRPGWAVLGIAIDASRKRLWAAAVALPQAEGYQKGDSGRASIMQFDLAAGRLTHEFAIPSSVVNAAPGDLVIAANGDLYSGDGRAGAVYRLRDGSDRVELLVPPGLFRSTQQPVLSTDGGTLIVAEYGRGLARVDVATGAVAWVSHPANVSLVGIDGLIRVGNALIAVQNLVAPSRVARFTLDARGAIVGGSVLVQGPSLPEPTHVALVDGALYAIANAGWDAFDDDGVRKQGVAGLPPRIVRLALPR